MDQYSAIICLVQINMVRMAPLVIYGVNCWNKCVMDPCRLIAQRLSTQQLIILNKDVCGNSNTDVGFTSTSCATSMVLSIVVGLKYNL